MNFKKFEDDELAPFLEKAKKREPAAFEPIVRRYEIPLRDWVAGHALPGVDVDEIAQRAFIAAYTQLSDFAAGSNFAAQAFHHCSFSIENGNDTYETTRRLPPSIRLIRRIRPKG